jgi:hypothetical protein
MSLKVRDLFDRIFKFDITATWATVFFVVSHHHTSNQGLAGMATQPSRYIRIGIILTTRAIAFEVIRVAQDLLSHASRSSVVHVRDANFLIGSHLLAQGEPQAWRGSLFSVAKCL